MPVIVSMAAQIAAIAMTDFMKRMGDFPPPNVLQAPFVQFGLAEVDLDRHDDAVDQSGNYPAISRDKLRHADARNSARWHRTLLTLD